ncbi:MAG: sigma-70 family RNA polymerase sigma factor [Anaerolineae bacterium]|nr:sigma-70 family RNA polymerase sigma factor [Anaerolineae bacterium]
MTADTVSLERLSACEPHALAKLYDDRAEAIYRYVYRRIGDAQTAEDLTGEVFLRALRALRRGKGWRRSPVAWLYRIAHNIVVDHYRWAARHNALPLEERALEPEPGAQELAEQRLEQGRLRRALTTLTEAQQQVVTLKFLEGLSNVEVAAILGRSEGAVKALQHRALASLRRTLAAEGIR